MSISTTTKNIQRNYHRSKMTSKGDFFAFLKMMLDDDKRLNLESCFACKVVGVNRESRQILVKPLSKQVYETGEQIERNAIPCTAWQFAAGKFVIDLPISEGDVGWCIAADRNFNTAKNTHDVQEEDSLESHKLSFGFFIPDFWGRIPSGEETDTVCYSGMEGRLVISSFNGKQRVHLGQNNVVVESISEKGQAFICLEDGDVVIEAPGSLYIDTPETTITGDLTVNGDITTKKSLTAATEVTAGTINLTTHKHSIPGGGSTDVPT